MNHLELKGPEKGLGKKCEPVLRTVPEWFGREEALREYVDTIETLDTYTAWQKDKLVGFFSVDYHNDYSAELHVLAVDKEYHRQGIGRKLLVAIESDLKARAIKLLQVKTLGTSACDDNYDKTRHFYIGMGFYPLEELADFWGKGTPCLLMMKCI
ncbi:GNAT family N-acetyltransferase [Vibrio penaeicida]|uniref:GNAT family N-acetyltransferase n=1 Tax=Vibrio penaeicida TaxID=104609 RepID=UPI002734ECB9|nr:GNAT family N-acetyltransferase [Vibrio penaeicida]MDP2571397.1 GNAT family N-acetyltransferase [Vibrio penaeicida]